MKHTKIIKDHRGTLTIEITLIVFDNGWKDIKGNFYRWDVNIWHTPIGKRKPFGVPENDIATAAEILSAKLELWHKIKPVIS